MSGDLDLTAAIEAASLAVLMDSQGDVDPKYAWSVQDEDVQEEMTHNARIAIEAALPHIREALAQQIEVEPDESVPGYFSVRPAGLIRRSRAARIVRGDS